MSISGEETRSVVIERTFPHAPQKLWRALTEQELLRQWIMSNDFEPVIARKFQFRAEPVPQWDGLIDCELLIFEPPTRVGYSWRSMGLDSVVLFTLTPIEGGTHLRIEHSGFEPSQHAAFKGANYGWQRFLGKLEELLQGQIGMKTSP